MENLPLIEHDCNKFAQKFVGTVVYWDIVIKEVKLIDNGMCGITFESGAYSSGIEYLYIDSQVFQNVKFAKRREKYKITAKISKIEDYRIELSDVKEFVKIT